MEGPKDKRPVRKQESAYIRIGGGLRFVTMDYFIRELEPLGVTTRGFRALCKALKVPMIRMGRTWLVELYAFQCAMRAISRPGQPDFLAPGSDLKSSGRAYNAVTELDMDYYERNMETIIGELLAARKASGLPTPKDTVRAARGAAKRILKEAAVARLEREGKIKEFYLEEADVAPAR